MGDLEIRAAIRNAIRPNRGVQVRIVQEPKPVQSKCLIFTPVQASDSKDCLDQKAFVKEVNHAPGSRFVAFNKQNLCGGPVNLCVQHGKAVIIDDTLALVSSGNFNAENLCDPKQHLTRCDRDYSYVTRDPDIVSTLVKVIEADLKGERYDLAALLSPKVSEKLTVSPFPKSPISRHPLVEFIQSSHSSIDVQNQYLKEPEINAALEAASMSNRSTRVMVASSCSFGRPSATEQKKWETTFSAFDRAEISSRMFTSSMQINGYSGYLHAKAILLDQNTPTARAWMGSVNGSTSATRINREFGVFFDDPVSVERLKAWMNADFANPNAVTWQQSLQCVGESL